MLEAELPQEQYVDWNLYQEPSEPEADFGSSQEEATLVPPEPESATLEKVVTICVPDSAILDKRRSPMWKEFLMIDMVECKDGKSRSICKHCQSASFIANSRYGTCNMKRHLEKCNAYQNSLKKGGATGTNFNQQVYRELVAKAIIKHGYAFSWVEHDGNRAIHAYLNADVKFITRNTAKADCLKLHQTYKAKLKAALCKVSGRISLTCDMWTSCQTEGYLCLTAHYVDVDWNLVSRVLNFTHIDTPHTGKTMYTVVLAMLQDWGIDDKIFSFTLDNASSNDKMQNYLKDTLLARGALLCDGDFFHVRRAAHVLNLIVKEGLKAIEHIVEKVRLCVKRVKFSEARKKVFRSCVHLVKLQETKSLWLDVQTRWNSTYMMIDRAIIYREAFGEMSEVQLCCPTSEEWEILEKIRDVLEPFHEITELFSGRDYPTSNLYFENVWKILMLLTDLEHDSDEILRNMAIDMKSKFDKYWFKSEDDDYGMLFAFAVILDPRCKLSVLKFCYEHMFGEVVATMKVNEIQYNLGKLYKLYVRNEASPTSNIDTSSRCKSSTNTSYGNRKRKYDYFAKYDDKEAFSSHAERSMLDVYLEDPKLDRTTKLDVLAYWKQNELRYKELSCLARDILAVPLTTVASESTFSIGGRILNKWRSCYLPENVEALITTRSRMFSYESNEEDAFVGTYVDWATTTSHV